MRIITLLTLTFLTGCAGFALPTVPPNALATTTPQARPSPTLPPTPSPVPTATAADTAVIVVPQVNVRQEPDGAVIGSLAAGDSVTVIECVSSWCKVEFLEQTGYIWAGCLDGYGEGKGCEAK